MTTSPIEHILQFFKYDHLPPHLQAVSKPFAELAQQIAVAEAVGEQGRGSESETRYLSEMTIRNHSTVKAIHSGGQSGADAGGLAAGLVLGLRTGGWAPKGYRVEGGSARWLAELGVREHAAPSYPPRTELNVRETDGTLVFGNIHSAGCSLTSRLAKKHGKPLFHVPWASGDLTPHDGLIEAFREWLDAFGIQVLNVAGNRESKQPGIRDATRIFLVSSLQVT